MKKIGLFALVLLALAGSVFAQTPPGAYTSPASGSSSGSGSTQAAVFDVRNYGWIGDNTTDNCGTPVTSLLAAVNGYTGAGTPQVAINAHTGDSGYKLSSCNLAFLIPVAVHLVANLNCNQASGANCIQFGPTGMSGFVNAQIPRYSLDGDGTITGCANVTAACIEVEPWVATSMVEDVQFMNAGAANATLGNCTNFAIKMDSPNPQFTIHHTFWSQTDGAVGRCWVSNASDGGIGSNTGEIYDNTAGTGGAVCGSIGLLEGGYQSAISENNLFSFGMSIRIQGNGSSGAKGTQIHHNQLDSNNCTAKTKVANIHYGGNGSAVVTGPVTVDGNSTNVTSTLIVQAGDSTGTITGWNVTNNVTQSGSGLIFGNATPPTCSSYGGIGIPNCIISGNMGFQPTSLLNGWTALTTSMTNTLAQTLAVNTGPTTIITPPSGGYYRVTCTVLLTQAATTSSTLPQCAIGWTDVFTSVALSDLITPVWAPTTVGCGGTTTNTVGNMCSASISILGKASTAITYTTSNYASVGGTPMQYLVDIRLELLP
jgi:hypothetical protein